MIVDLSRVLFIGRFPPASWPLKRDETRAWMVDFLPLNSPDKQCTLMRDTDVAELFRTGRSATDV